MKTWDTIFFASCRRGDAPCYAMFLADEYVKRKRPVKLFDQLRQCLELESQAHALFDDACSNLAYGKLSKELRDGYVEKTYEATRLHAQAQQTLRDMAAELNQVLGTGYHLD